MIKLKILNANVCDCGQEHENSLKLLYEVSKSMDIIALQEAHTYCDDPDRDIGEDLAKSLKMNYEHSKPVGTSLLSRFPLDHGRIRLNSKKELVYKNIHLTDDPYEPFEITGIKYSTRQSRIESPEEAEESSKKTRSKELKKFMNIEVLKDMPCIVSGDFNEPSHLDWTHRAARDALVPFPVRWYCSTWLESKGFQDVYRYVRPDEVSYPGFTWGAYGYDKWSAMAKKGMIRKERVDFIYVTKEFEIIDCKLVGLKNRKWLSDHYALQAELSL